MNIDFAPTTERLQRIINDIIAAIPSIVVALLIFAVFWVIGRLSSHLALRIAQRSQRRQNLGLVVGRILHWFILLFGLLIGAVVIFPDFSPAEMIQLLGLGSVAVGFAFRDVLQNFLVGILLLLNEPFRIGDQIIVHDSDLQGTVENITGRAATIRTYDGRRIVVPNAKLYTETVTVITAFERRRIEYDVAVSYGSDINLAKEVILNAVNESHVEDVLVSPPPQVFVVSLADYSINLRVRWWIKPPLYQTMVESRDLILETIYQRIQEAEGVSIPFPTSTIHLENTES